VLVGATANGEIVRNRMLWTYTMGCGMEDYTVLDGNVIGWAGFVSVMVYVIDLFFCFVSLFLLRCYCLFYIVLLLLSHTLCCV
jgi:hypothetical protein